MVSGDKLCDPYPVLRENRFRHEVSGCQISEEPNLRSPPKPGLQEIDNFRHDELRHNQRTRVRFQQSEALLVIAVILVDVGI